MGKLLELNERLKTLTPEAIEAEVLSIVKENEATITGMNTDQLFGGEDSKGKKLPEYSKRSVEVFGKKAGSMTLFDTGDFYRGFFVRSDKFPISIFSNDRKTGKIADLLAAKGEDPDDIYGLQKQNLEDLNKNYILASLQKFVRDFLGIR